MSMAGLAKPPAATANKSCWKFQTSDFSSWLLVRAATFSVKNRQEDYFKQISNLIYCNWVTSWSLKCYESCYFPNSGCIAGTPDFGPHPQNSHFSSIPQELQPSLNFTCPTATLQLCNEDRLEAQAEEQPVEPTGKMKDFSVEKKQSSLEL